MQIELKENDSKGLAIALENQKRIGTITYSIAGWELIIIDHTEVEPEYNGKGIGKKILFKIVEMAREKNGPEIAFQLLLWPLVDSDTSRPSYKKFAQGRFLTTPIMEWMWDMYIPNPEDRKQKYVSPINASLEELKGLPPTLIQVAENDILYDEGVAYGRKLDEAGVSTTITVYKGFIHDYGMLNPLSHIQGVQEALTQAAVVLRKSLFENIHSGYNSNAG